MYDHIDRLAKEAELEALWDCACYLCRTRQLKSLSWAMGCEVKLIGRGEAQAWRWGPPTPTKFYKSFVNYCFLGLPTPSINGDDPSGCIFWLRPSWLIGDWMAGLAISPVPQDTKGHLEQDSHDMQKSIVSRDSQDTDVLVRAWLTREDNQSDPLFVTTH